MNYDLISSLKVEELKSYLKEGGLKTSGRRVELVARVFAACENNVLVVKSAIEIEADLIQDWIVVVIDYKIRFPWKKDGWKKKKEGDINKKDVRSKTLLVFPVVFSYPKETGLKIILES